MKKSLAVTLMLVAGVANAELAPVVRSEPIIRNEPVMVARNTCQQQPVYEQSRSSGGAIGAVNDTIFGSTGGLVGAVVGGVIGNQVGGGSGRDVARIAGVVIGAKMGDEYSRENEPRHVAGYRAPCGTSYSNEIQQVVTGYKVTYILDGRTRTAVLPYNPGSHVNVERTVTVR